MSRGKNTNNKKRELKSTIKKLKQLFKKLTYPVKKNELIDHAQMGGGGDAPVYIVDSLSENKYEHFNDLSEELDAYYEKKVDELNK